MCCLGDFFSYVIVDNKHFKKNNVFISFCVKISSFRRAGSPQLPRLHYPQCTKGASNKEVSWRWYFVIDEPRHCVSPDFLVTDSWIHGFTAAQWVRGDPEPPALQRHLFPEQRKSCQTCIDAWRRRGRTISTGLLWQLTGRTFTCSVCFMSCSTSLWFDKTMLWFVYIRFIPVGSCLVGSCTLQRTI